MMAWNPNPQPRATRPVPILGELELGCDYGDADAVKINMVHASGHVDVLKQGDNDRRWWVVGAEAVPLNWPGQHLRMLPALQRTHDATADLHGTQGLSDCYHYCTDDGTVVAAGHRHTDTTHQKWRCSLFIRDQAGNEWGRFFTAVTDDFVWLVEVPAC